MMVNDGETLDDYNNGHLTRALFPVTAQPHAQDRANKFKLLSSPLPAGLYAVRNLAREPRKRPRGLTWQSSMHNP